MSRCNRKSFDLNDKLIQFFTKVAFYFAQDGTKTVGTTTVRIATDRIAIAGIENV